MQIKTFWGIPFPIVMLGRSLTALLWRMQNLEESGCVFDTIQGDLLLEIPKESHCTKASFIIEPHGMHPVHSLTV